MLCDRPILAVSVIILCENSDNSMLVWPCVMLLYIAGTLSATCAVLSVARVVVWILLG